MKKSLIKKILSAAVAVICVLACIFAIGACDGKGDGDGGDKIVNEEFSEFLEKVTAVLNDYDIAINKTELSVASSTGAQIATAGYEDNKGQIVKLITEDKAVNEDKDTVSNAREDIFQQSLYAGVIIGDGMTTYHKEKNFYGISVYIEEWNQFFEVTKDGNATFVRCYTQESEYTSESCITLRLDFNSAGDYSFVFIQSADYGVTYAYGNSQKEFLAFSYTDNPDSCFAMYSDSIDSGYYLVSQSTVANVKKFFDTEIDAVKLSDFLPLKQSKYSLNKTQTDSIMQKYFTYSSSSGGENREKGLATQTYNGVTVAQYFVADGETELVIPEGVDYIVKGFRIDSEGKQIKKLSLPSSLKGVVEEKEGENIVEGGNVYINYKTIAAHEFYLNCYDFKSGTEKYYTLEEISVAGGNSVYKSEGGHLYTLDGTPAYLVNAPIDNFDINYFLNDDIRMLIEEGQYDRLIKSIREITVTSECMANDSYGVINSIISKVTALQTLNITSYDIDSEESLNSYFDFTANNDITVNLRLNSDMQCVALNINEGAAPANITLNLIELCETENVVLNAFANYGEGSDLLNMSVNANFNELDYIIKYRQCINIDGFNTKVFTYAQQLIIDGFKFRALNDFGDAYALELTEFTDGGEILVPDNIQGVDIDIVLLPAEILRGKTLRVVLATRKEIHIVTYAEEGGYYPYVQGLKYGELINENISIVLPYDNIEGAISVLSLRHMIRAVYTNTDEIIMDSETYDALDKVNITVLVGDNVRNIYNVPLAVESNKVQMPVYELEGYIDWENLAFTDDEGNLYPVTIEGDIAYFYIPKDFTSRQLRIVGDNEVALTVNLLGEKALEVAIPRNYRLLLQEKVNEDGSRDVYYGIAYNHEIEEEIFAFTLPDEKTIGSIWVEYEFNDLWNNYGKKASVELDLRDVEYYEITFMLHSPYKSDDEVIQVSRFGERAKIVFPDVENSFVDGSGNNLYFKCWTQYGREYPDEVIDNLTAGQDEHYAAKYIGDRVLNIAFIMQDSEVGRVEVAEDNDFFIGEEIDVDTGIRSIYFNLYEYEWSQQYDKRQIICQLPQGKMLRWQSNKYEFYNIFSYQGSNAQIVLDIDDVEYYEITFAMRSPVDYEEVTTLSTIRVEARYIIPFCDADEFIVMDGAIFKFECWLDEDGGGTSVGYETAYRNVTYYARYEWYASEDNKDDTPEY